MKSKVIGKEYCKLDNPSRKKVLKCGDRFAREHGWIPVDELVSDNDRLTVEPKQPEAPKPEDKTPEQSAKVEETAQSAEEIDLPELPEVPKTEEKAGATPKPKAPAKAAPKQPTKQVSKRGRKPLQ